jgi:hypothetical protein
MPVLTRKKPCTIVGFENAQKMDDLAACPGTRHCPECNNGRKIKGVSRMAGKNGIFPENRVILPSLFAVR